MLESAQHLQLLGAFCRAGLCPTEAGVGGVGHRFKAPKGQKRADLKVIMVRYAFEMKSDQPSNHLVDHLKELCVLKTCQVFFVFLLILFRSFCNGSSKLA